MYPRLLFAEKDDVRVPTEDAFELEEDEETDEKDRSKDMQDDADDGCKVGDGDADRLGETSVANWVIMAMISWEVR